MLTPLCVVKLMSFICALQLDTSLIPFITAGPSSTPSIKNYDVPDGEMVDVSPKWD